MEVAVTLRIRNWDCWLGRAQQISQIFQFGVELVLPGHLHLGVLPPPPQPLHAQLPAQWIPGSAGMVSSPRVQPAALGARALWKEIIPSQPNAITSSATAAAVICWQAVLTF